jgi:hypothetical protein
MGNLERPVALKEMEFVGKCLPEKKYPGSEGF